METSHPIVTLLVLLAASSVSAQTKPVRRVIADIESRQGNHPEGDVIGHAKVSKGDTVTCTQVEVYDATHQTMTACMVRFGSGSNQKLAINESIAAPEDSEAYLECAGDKPRKCAVKVETLQPIAHQTD